MRKRLNIWNQFYFLNNLKSDIEIGNIFCHSNVFRKMSQVMWDEGDKYKGIIIIVGDVFYKNMDPSIRHHSSNTIQEEHDYVNKLWKLLFASNATHWRKIFQLNFINERKKLRQGTTLTNLLALCKNEYCKHIKQQILTHSRAMDK